MTDTSKRSEGLPAQLRDLLEMLKAQDRLPTGASHSFSVAEAKETKQSFEDFYNQLGSQLDSTRFGRFSFFLNYGYVADESPQFSVIELPDGYINRNSVKLVLELIGDCDLNDRRILDVGCGRGGTIRVIKEFFRPASVTGVDLSKKSIEFCQKLHTYPNVTFHEGDAENLSFEDSAFDVVTNVESSHCYPNISAFFNEVFRVLAPGGYFLYTDFMQLETSDRHVEILRSLGFQVERDRDATANVILSCDQVAFSRVHSFQSGRDASLMQYFLAAPGSPVYEGMKSRATIYRILKLRKTPLIHVQRG